MNIQSRHWRDRIDIEQPGFHNNVKDIATELIAIMCRKQLDYGPDNINNAYGGALNGLLVRMGDKYERIKNLTIINDSNINDTKTAVNEPLEDSFIDLANYCIIALMVLKDQWPKGQTECEQSQPSPVSLPQSPAASQPSTPIV